MKIYLVGGAVRDKLLGLPIKERDYVVVGATVNEMLALGFKQVGKEFPVFLHPETREEYALARKERKVNPGYKGFTFDTSQEVLLIEDLKRRDLTINAMAETESGDIIDPYHGQIDLQKRLLRHVSEAFAEDPVRILRIARFLARYARLQFHIAPETKTLMIEMVKAGEVNALVAERVWKELERALAEPNPEQFFTVLEDCGAKAILFPGLNPISYQALMIAAEHSQESLIRFAALMHCYGTDPTANIKEMIKKVCQRYAVPTAYTELAWLTALHYQAIFAAEQYEACTLLQLLTKLDVFRREKRFKKLLEVVQILAKTYKTPFNADFLRSSYETVKKVDIQALLKEGLPGPLFAEKLQKARLALLENWLSTIRR